MKDRVLSAARAAGFDLAGVAAVGDFAEHRHLEAWIVAGRAAEMGYMAVRDEAGALKRASLARVAPWARSVVVCAANYNTAQPYSTEGSDRGRGWIARYAWSREDYHDAVLRKLREVEAESVALLCCEALSLEGADYCRGYIQNWLYQGVGYDADAIPEKSAQKIFRAADQILRAGRPTRERSAEYAN